MWMRKSDQENEDVHNHEGSGVALETSDPEYLNPPPFKNMPDLAVGWFSEELLDCNTLKTTLSFFGLYFGAGVWEPGTPWTGMGWISGGKIPLVTRPIWISFPSLPATQSRSSRPTTACHRRSIRPYCITRSSSTGRNVAMPRLASANGAFSERAPDGGCD